MSEKKRTKEFKKNQLSDQEIDLRHKSITCPSKGGVISHIIVLRTCVQRHGTKIRYVQGTLHRYQCMSKMVASLYAAIETQRRIFCYVSKYSFGDPTDCLKYGHIS
jgi:hypothetical protein